MLKLTAEDGGWPRVVISDVHLGSSHCRIEELERFLDLLPAEALLILNGDTIDAPGQVLPQAHQQVLERFAGLAREGRLIWIFGNHDDGYMPIEPGAWPPARVCELEGQLLVLHGDRFDNVMPRYRWFLKLFKSLHRLRMKLAKPVHVARYAKHFKPLYDFLCDTVQGNAIEHAQEHGVRAITCGHVHRRDDEMREGIRYLNTGCWTEEEATCIIVEWDGMRLVEVNEVLAASVWGN